MSNIITTKQNHIVTITLNNPDQLNAMTVSMGKEFQKAIKTIGKDKNVRVVLLTGAGRAFSAGGNLEMLNGLMKLSKPEIAKKLKAFYKMYLSLRDIPQVVISAINGHAIGAGFCLAMACDLRFASEKAKLGANFAKLGLAPGMAGTYLMTRLVGPVFASEILLTGKIFDAKKAAHFGLVNDIFAEKDFLKNVTAIAKDIAINSPLALKQIKKGIQLAQHKTMEQMFDYDAKCQAHCLKTQDVKEGLKAVKEKRPPNFQGK